LDDGFRWWGGWPMAVLQAQWRGVVGEAGRAEAEGASTTVYRQDGRDVGMFVY
jgi:hypothetical protein